MKATFPEKIVSIVPNSDLTKVIINTSSEKDPEKIKDNIPVL